MSSGGSSFGNLKNLFESNTFPRQSLFANMGYLYWRVSPQMDVINLHENYGISGMEEIIKDLVIYMLIPWAHLTDRDKIFTLDRGTNFNHTKDWFT